MPDFYQDFQGWLKQQDAAMLNAALNLSSVGFTQLVFTALAVTFIMSFLELRKRFSSEKK